MYTHSTEAGWVSRTHKAIHPFRLQKPETVDEALSALSADENTTLIAGGIDLIRRMRGGDEWETVVDISGVAELGGIVDDGEVIRLGALTTHWEIENDPVLANRLPLFQAAWKTIGNVRIRMMGTLGGNLMAGEAGYDGAVLLGAVGARVIFRGPEGESSVSATAGLKDFPRKALLTAVEIPVAAAERIAFDRSLKPVVSVAVCLQGDVANVAVGCAFDTPYHWSGSPDQIDGSFMDSLPEPKDNPMGRAAYRRRMAGVLARRLTNDLQAGESA